MKKENMPVIHVRFEHSEAVNSKRDLLSLEMTLLEAMKSVTNYHSLRAEELRLKLKLYLRTREYLSLIRKLKKLLPKYKLPKILQEAEEEKNHFDKTKQEQEVKPRNDVDSQLEEIRSKLQNLQ
ncbi:MAG: hypothetical protein OQK82_06615 [Candidatus Pacearchaeota archaeon]|nr:hypothetical protein [Candidatus Pacearchaeota archaeon]